MKTFARIGIILMLLLLTFSIPVSANSPVLLCRVDIGDEESEAGHYLDSWGPLEPDTHPWTDYGEPWSGLDGGKARVIWGYFDNTRCATLTLNRCIAPGTASFIRFRHLDGLYLDGIAAGEQWADDSFTLSVKNHGDPDTAYQLIYTYDATGHDTSTSQWLIHEVVLPETLDLDGFIDVKLCATGDRWPYFGCDLGQVAFDWIELWGCTHTGTEGLTPGYWKNHLDAWVGHATDDDFDTVFGVDAFDPDITLLDALKLHGGHIKALARHAVAALLNISSPEIDYPYTEAELIAMVQDAVASGDYEPVKDLLDEANNLGNGD